MLQKWGGGDLGVTRNADSERGDQRNNMLRLQELVHLTERVEQVFHKKLIKKIRNNDKKDQEQ